MFAASLFMLAFAASSLAQIPAGYRAIYMTSAVDTKFVVQPKTNTAGATLVVQTLASTPIQQWWLKDGNTSIQLANTTLCMDAGKSGWKDMGPIAIKECSATEEGQKWTVMADGRIAVTPSKSPQECIDLQYMRATPGNAVGLYNCAGLGNTGAADKGINWPLKNVTA